MSETCSAFPSTVHGQYNDKLNCCFDDEHYKRSNLFSNSFVKQSFNDKFCSSTMIFAAEDLPNDSPPIIGVTDCSIPISNIGTISNTTELSSKPCLDGSDTVSADSETKGLNHECNDNMAEIQSWKLLKIYTNEELLAMSVTQLHHSIDALHAASQAASACLVPALQLRHTLEEEVELRSVLIEQLLRWTASRGLTCSPQPYFHGIGGESESSTGRG